jgi:cell fate regulator YaaT (PSP1 superfamily)
MAILDAEYQYDRHKLTFFFEADKRIDFRDLVSELFSQYKTRIWMQQVDTTTLPLADAGSDLAKATGFLPEREEDVTPFRQIGPTGSFESDKPIMMKYNESASMNSTGRYPSLDLYDKRPFNSMVFSDPWAPSRL